MGPKMAMGHAQAAFFGVIQISLADTFSSLCYVNYSTKWIVTVVTISLEMTCCNTLSFNSLISLDSLAKIILAGGKEGK